MIPADFPWSARMLIRDADARSDAPPRIVIGVRMWMDLPVLVWVEDGATDCDVLERGEGLADLYVPDLTDPATIGALAGAVREAYGSRRVGIHHLPRFCQARALNVYPDGNYDYSILGEGPDEAAAWIAAWTARPRSST